MKFFFAGSIRGGRDQQPMFETIVNKLSTVGEVLNPHVANDDISDFGETNITKKAIHERELKRLAEADILVAEVTTASLGVGFLISEALQLQKPVVCFYQGDNTYKLSAMIKGDERVRVYTYQQISELDELIEQAIQKNG